MPPDFNDISICFQGPRDNEITEEAPEGITKGCMARARLLFPQSTIMFSTWMGTSVEDLPIDDVVFCKDPGGHPFNHNDGVSLNNTVRMLRTTRSAIEQVRTKFTLKLRSDLFMYDRNFLGFFDKYNSFFAPLRVFEKRVLVFSLWTRAFHAILPGPQLQPFHVSDWAQFGLTTDLAALWSAEEPAEPEFSTWFATRPRLRKEMEPERTWRYPPEQLLGISALERTGLPGPLDGSDTRFGAMAASRAFLATNFVALDQFRWRMISLKLPFFQPFLPFFIYRGLYTFDIWHRDYQALSTGILPTGKRGAFRHKRTDINRMARNIGGILGLNEVSASRYYRRIAMRLARI